MRPAIPWRSWIQRVLRLGPSRLGLILAILLALVALALPFWSLSSAAGADQDVNSFSWTTITTERYVNGAWRDTTIQPYRFSAYPSVAGVLGPSYILVLAFLIVLGFVLALYSTDFGQLLPTLSLLTVSLIVVGIALIALFYPIVAIPGAATTDVGTFTIGGFWGSGVISGTAWSWGPGLGWWFLLFAVVLGTFGAILPYVKNIRAMVPPPPPPP